MIKIVSYRFALEGQPPVEKKKKKYNIQENNIFVPS